MDFEEFKMNLNKIETFKKNLEIKFCKIILNYSEIKHKLQTTYLFFLQNFPRNFNLIFLFFAFNNYKVENN